MTTVVTRGAASAQALGYASSSAAVNYIEDVFSTYLVKPTTSNTTYSVTNGIDVSGEGGMVWMKARSAGSTNNLLYDTVRGASSIANNALISNSSSAQQTANFDYITGLSNGFTVNFASGGGQLTNNGINYVSWTFRKQPKFFDVVTYTGDGVAGRTVAHNLGSAPGCMFVKRTDAVGAWHVFHTSLGGTKALFLNATNAALTNIRYWNDTAPTSTVFTLGFDTDVNASGGTYVAYLFAHNAGGFGLTGTDNVVSCGSFTTSGAGTATVNLGYEPQWLLLKNSTSADNWYILDNMRGFSMTQGISLNPNLTAAESDYFGGNTLTPNATGFSINNNIGASQTWIYVAIRRGPMKVPTDATKVFTPIAATASTGTSRTVGFPADLTINTATGISGIRLVADRLRGYANASSDLPPMLDTNNDTAERTSTAATVYNVWNTTALDGPYYNSYASIWWHFRRAPGYFDVCCYTGTGSARTVTHNLAVVPELIIVKSRSGVRDWVVYAQALGATQGFYLNQPDAAVVSSGFWNNTAPTSSVFTVNTNVSVNGSGSTYVAYLFATCPGVSKVGSYTGTGTTLQINCGFTAGSRFVLIKRTDAPGGDWYLWDSARGIVAGNDPYLLLNSTAAEVTSTDYVDTYSAGFEISSTAPAAINANGGSFIFFAVS